MLEYAITCYVITLEYAIVC